MPAESTNSRPYLINMVSLRMAHHASASGYDKLTDYIDARVIHAPQELSIFERGIGKLFKSSIRKSGLAWYHCESLLTEMAVAKQWLLKRGQVFHFLYGENQFRYTGLLSRIKKGNIIVCTYHTPEERFREVVINPDYLNELDAVIVVSEIQKQIFQKHLPKDRIFFVPHGVDTKVFSPAPDKRLRGDGKVHCIAVGSHMRDYATLAEAVRILAETTEDICFDVVTRENLFFHFADLPNVNLHSGVTDETLISMYRNADLMVLPMLDATANNSVLEAMACGLPIISTDLPGVHDYVDPECAVLIANGDPSGLAAAVLALSQNRARLDAMGEGSRTKALQFDWERIAKKTLDVYDVAWAAQKWQVDLPGKSVEG